MPKTPNIRLTCPNNVQLSNTCLTCLNNLKPAKNTSRVPQ